MNTKYIYNQKEKCVQIERTYQLNLNITKDRKTIIIQKERLTSSQESESHFTHDTHFKLTGADVDKQLSNVKHKGFEVTDGCNLACTYCAYGKYYNDYDIRRNEKIDFKKATLFLDFLLDKLHSPSNENKVNEIYISFYGGEPLLNFEFIEKMVLYTQHQQTSSLVFHYMMTTNAILLKKHISFLVAHDFRLTISLDGSSINEGYRKFSNGKPSFDLVFNNVKYAQKAYPDYFTKRVNFNSVMHNLNSVQDVFSFIYEEFGKIPNFSNLNPTGIKPSYQQEFDEMSKTNWLDIDPKVEKSIREVLGLEYGEYKRLQKFILNYCGNLYDNYNYLLVRDTCAEKLPTGTCFPFSRRIFMTVNNKIFPCERIGHQYFLGLVTNEGVQIDCEYIAHKYNTYYNKLNNQCSRCYFRQHCSQCMFSIEDLDTNPVCNQIADQQKFERYMQANMSLLREQPFLYNRMMKEIIIEK